MSIPYGAYSVGALYPVHHMYFAPRENRHHHHHQHTKVYIVWSESSHKFHFISCGVYNTHTHARCAAVYTYNVKRALEFEFHVWVYKNLLVFAPSTNRCAVVVVVIYDSFTFSYVLRCVCVCVRFEITFASSTNRMDISICAARAFNFPYESATND